MKGCREMFKCVKAELPNMYSSVYVEGTAVGHMEVEKFEPYLVSYDFLKLFLHLIEQLFEMLLALHIYIVFTVL